MLLAVPNVQETFPDGRRCEDRPMIRPARLVQLLMLLQRRGRVSTAAAAACLGVPRRTALEDLKTLAEIAPVCHVGEGRSAEWVLAPVGARESLGPLDALALQVGRDAVSFLRGTTLEHCLERAVRSAPPVPPRFSRHLDRKLRLGTSDPTTRTPGTASTGRTAWSVATSRFRKLPIGPPPSPFPLSGTKSVGKSMSCQLIARGAIVVRELVARVRAVRSRRGWWRRAKTHRPPGPALRPALSGRPAPTRVPPQPCG
jgi:hypothetical protein